MTGMLNLPMLVDDEREKLRRGWGGFVLLGCLLVALGFVGLVFVGLLTYISVLFVGWAFIIGGIAEVVHAIIRKGWSGFLIDFISGIITTVVGVLILACPVTTASVLTIVIGVLFLVGGIFRVAAGIALKSPYAWWFVLFGFVSIMLGLMIISEWPKSALWLIGTLVAIDLLVDGARLLAFGLAIRHLHGSESTDQPAPAHATTPPASPA
jgi:uncharacterized membrane protein HdeD (DUF308 family)